MRKAMFCVAGVVAGLALMTHASLSVARPDPSWPWSRARIYVGGAEPAGEAVGFAYVPLRIRFLGVTGLTQALSETLRRANPASRTSFLMASQEKLVQYPYDAGLLDQKMLASGRLPEAGTDEVLAGANSTEAQTLTIEDMAFPVVGRLREDALVFSDSYVLFADESEDPLFDVVDWRVEPACLVYPEESAAAGDAGAAALAKAFPSATFVPYGESRRAGRPAFWSFIAGEALVLLCGSYLLTRLFCLLAHAKLPGVLKAPLVEIERRRRLFAALAMSYFGLVIVFTLAAAAAPLLHLFYLSITRTAFTQGLPGLVAAYTQGHIVKAALLTLLVNFFLGSILTITVPSTLIPGSGVLMAIFRPAAWGFLLAPVYATLLERMVPHSLTLLVEGTAYVMAAFFALLYPVSLFSNPDNKPIGRRYLEALYMNLKGSLLVLALLAVAAIYEAIEVILAM